MIRYVLNTLVFHVAYLLQSLPGLSFRVWVPLMQIKLRAAKNMSKAKDIDYENIGC